MSRMISKVAEGRGVNNEEASQECICKDVLYNW